MKINALIPAALFAIIGSSSLAMARPIISGSAQVSVGWNTRGPVVRDHRTPTYQAPVAPVRSYEIPDTRWERDYRQPRFQVLDDNMQFGLTEYRKDIAVGSAAGRFNTLRVESDGGQTYLMKIVVEFADNSVQVINLNRTLRGQQSLTLPLDFRKAIGRVFVYRADGDAAYNMRTYHNGSFTVTAM